MNINIKLGKNFTTTLNKLQAQYGEEFEKINGLSEENLNLSQFIDNFIDAKNTADSTIDANANVQSKDICNLINEIPKPYLKLLGFNKLFYEIQKKYGFKRAQEALEAEWRGDVFIHNSSDISFRPYCVLGTECCFFLYNGKKLYATFEQMYDLIDAPEEYDEEQHVYFKKPSGLKVLDYDKENDKTRYTKVTCISKKETDKDYYYTKAINGTDLITTGDHKFISKESDIEAAALKEKDIIYSCFDDDAFTGTIDVYNGFPLNEETGWLVGIYLAEGYNNRGQLSICQNKDKSGKEWDRIIAVLENLGIPYTTYKDNTLIHLRNGDENWERKMLTIIQGKYAYEKALCPDFVHFNDDFLKGILSGIIDGDGTIAQNRTCMIRMSSRRLINQIKAIGLHFGVYFSGRYPYIQKQTGSIQQKRPIYCANCNMNIAKDFFLSLNSRKVQELYTHYDYDEKFANHNYVRKMGEVWVRDCIQTYKTQDTVYDLSTESHTFVCNNILIHNCFNYDLEALATKGMFFISNLKTRPAQHLTTFCDHLLEFISWVANRQSGASSVANALMWLYWFWKKDVESGHYIKSPEYYRDQAFQKVSNIA